jgi:hypothetical protein
MEKDFIYGELLNDSWAAKQGYFAFRHTSAGKQQPIETMVLFSNELENN